jgi:hypothetical protein
MNRPYLINNKANYRPDFEEISDVTFFYISLLLSGTEFSVQLFILTAICEIVLFCHNVRLMLMPLTSFVAYAVNKYL